VSTSINIENAQLQVREKILAPILNNFNVRLNQIDEFDNQIKEWEKICSHMDKEVSFHNDEDIIVGIFKGLTDSGAARVIVNEQEIIFNSGELVTL
jgi:biotin-(acetyl-CoA carboxylase) ligase